MGHAARPKPAEIDEVHARNFIRVQENFHSNHVKQ